MAPPTLIETGELAGWMTWAKMDPDRFVDVALGPLFFRDEPDGSVRCRIDTARAHTNNADILHGGFLMSFADMALYAMAWRCLAKTRAVTLTCNFEFLGAGVPDRPVEAVDRVVKETRRTLFVQALAEQDGRPVLAFSGTLRKISVRTGGDA